MESVPCNLTRVFSICHTLLQGEKWTAVPGVWPGSSGCEEHGSLHRMVNGSSEHRSDLKPLRFFCCLSVK